MLVDSFMNAILGKLYVTQILHGPAVSSMLSSESFRREMRAHVRLSVPLERFSPRESAEAFAHGRWNRLKAVVQRVSYAEVLVDATPIGRIEHGLLVFLGVHEG